MRIIIIELEMQYNTHLLTIFILFVSSHAFNDDVSLVRQRILEQMIWPPASTIPSLGPAAIQNAKTLNNSCYWPDVDYTDQTRALWLTQIHLTRVTTMIQAYTINGSTEQYNTKLIIAAHCALNVWLTRDWQNPNWWYNQISVPIIVTSQLLMLGDHVTNFEVEKIKQISYRANWWSGSAQSTGTNLLWMIQAQLYRSLATQNLTGIEQGFSRVWQDISFVPLYKDGIQNDYSYHFHGKQLFSAGYGSSWADNVFSFFMCTNGTRFAPKNQQLTLFAEFITEGEAWMIIGSQWDLHSIGRSLAEPYPRYDVQFPPTSIRALGQTITSLYLRNALNDLADRLENRSDAKFLLGNKHFYTSDYQSHRRANWTAALKLQSVRTVPGECANSENIKAEHIGQGVLYLYTTNTDDYIQLYGLFDWAAINGITVEHDIPLEPCVNGEFHLTQLTFVGGVSDGQYGLAMMDTATHNLTAQRSWHFYDDAIIALATNLTLTTPNIAWTTLASRKLLVGQVTVGFFNSTIITLTDGNYSFPFTSDKTSNVQWVHVGETDFGYVLQGQGQYASLGIEVGNKTGNFDTIGAWNVNVTWRTLKIWIDHGRGPYTLDYEYMILPNVSLEAMPAIIKQYEEEQIFSCISSNKLFHGTMWPTLKRASFVLWDNVTTTFSCKSPSFELNIELSDAGAYLFSETETDFTVTASQPVRVNGAVKVTVDRIGQGQGCSSSIDNENASTTSVILPLPSSTEFIGASVQTKCNKH